MITDTFRLYVHKSVREMRGRAKAAGFSLSPAPDGHLPMIIEQRAFGEVAATCDSVSLRARSAGS